MKPTRKKTKPKAKAKARAAGRAKPGRKPKLTPEVVARIAQRIGRGMTHAQATILEGVTLDAWDKARARHAEFRHVVDLESAKFVENSLDIICEPGGGPSYRDWRGRAWILERRHSTQFGRSGVTVQMESHTHSHFAVPQALLDEIANFPPPEDAQKPDKIAVRFSE